MALGVSHTIKHILADLVLLFIHLFWGEDCIHHTRPLEQRTVSLLYLPVSYGIKQLAAEKPGWMNDGIEQRERSGSGVTRQS